MILQCTQISKRYTVCTPESKTMLYVLVRKMKLEMRKPAGETQVRMNVNRGLNQTVGFVRSGEN